ncbi:hypothetical protein FJT64_016262 [Amphibalanus amphitrite]|uniref:Uncharacterized protein n=1 Tax=Amphibalanus amphitrite TaxID=1232801 RepID=A0A6A4XF84_AMPAM|nr:hypothetical protein FJT64_016262 [Amphibalanus amphitrite]
MSRIWLQIFLIFCVTSVSQPSPTGSPSQLACRSLLERSATCQITYTGWQELTECLRGVSVHVPDIEEAITCTCVPQPPPIIEQGTEYDLPTPLPPTPVGPPVLPEMEDDFPDHGDERDSFGDALSSDLPSSPSGAGANLNNRPITGPQWMKARGTNLADFDYVAPDGSVAMASRARPPGVAGPAAVVLAVLVVVLLGVVIVLGCSRRRAEVDSSLEEEYEEGEGGGEEEEGQGNEGVGEEGLKRNDE